MSDGSVKIDVGLNLAKAEKDLEKLKAKIAKAETELNANASKKTALEEQIRTVGAQADEATRKVQELKDALSQTSNRGEKAAIRAQLAEATEEQRILTKESNRLNDEYVKVNQKLEQGTTDLTEMKNQAGELVREINAARPGEALSKGFEQAKKSLMKFLKYAIGIRSVYFLFRRIRSAIKDAVKSFAEYDDETKRNLKTMEATKNAIKTAFGAGLASNYNAILPVVQKIANWMLDAANAASRFIAILSGKETYRKAVVSTSEIEQNMADTEKETKETKKQLMGFDELNILSSDKSSEKSKIDKTALDGVEMIEEAVDAFDGSFLSNLAIAVKDVLFDWSDLNPEQIVEKIIAGLGGLLGAVMAISLGFGPGGIVLMTIAGVTLGLIADALIFNHDGRISNGELSKMLIAALMGLIGFVAGFVLTGSLASGIIGSIIGATLALYFHNLIIGKGSGFDVSSFKKNLFLMLNSIFAGILGLAITGTPAGGLIGVVIGFGLTMLLQEVMPKLSPKAQSITGKICKLLTIVAGGLVGFAIGTVTGAGVAGAIIGTIVATLAVTIASILLKDEPPTDQAFAAEMNELKEKIEQSMEMNVNIKAHIDSITGEIDERTMADLTAAQQIIDDIFTLDAKDTKTSEEIAEIKGNIEALNSMGLPGVFLTFDEATGHVNGTHDAMQLVLDDLLRQYQYEALKEAYIESFRAQYEAVQVMSEAEERYIETTKKAAEKEAELKKKTDEYNEALTQLNNLKNMAWKDRPDNYSELLAEASDRLSAASDALDIAKGNVELSKEVVTSAETDLEDKVNLAEKATAKVSEITAAFSAASKESAEAGKNTAESFGDSIKENSQGSVDAAIEQAKKTLEEGYDKTLGIASPSEEAHKRGAFTSEGFKEGIEEGTSDAVAAAKTAAEKVTDQFEDGADNTVTVAETMRSTLQNVFSGIVSDVSSSLDQMRQLMNFTWEIPRPLIPRIGMNISTIPIGNGQAVSIPEFFVDWYARGGVFNSPRLIGVGEDGKEAVVPLEKNTGWMQTVADGLMDRLTQANFANELASAFMSTPLPAMAGGGVIPPNAIRSDYGGWSSAESIIEELRALRSAILSQPIEVDSNMYMDGDKIGKKVTMYQRRQERARG